jgi:hypothetical protein
MRRTAFSVGRRYRVEKEAGKRDPVFEFVILGPPSYAHNNPKTHKSCRIEVIQHSYSNLDSDGKCCQFCSHGSVQDYSHTHLKKYGVLLP